MLSKPSANHCSKIIVRWDSACCVFIQCRHSLFNCCLYSVFIHLSTVSWYNYFTWLQYLVQVLLPCFQYTSSLLLLSLILAVKKTSKTWAYSFTSDVDKFPAAQWVEHLTPWSGFKPWRGESCRFCFFFVFSSFFILADYKSLYVDTHIIPHRIGSLVLFKM